MTVRQRQNPRAAGLGDLAGLNHLCRVMFIGDPDDNILGRGLRQNIDNTPRQSRDVYEVRKRHAAHIREIMRDRIAAAHADHIDFARPEQRVDARIKRVQNICREKHRRVFTMRFHERGKRAVAMFVP